MKTYIHSICYCMLSQHVWGCREAEILSVSLIHLQWLWPKVCDVIWDLWRLKSRNFRQQVRSKSRGEKASPAWISILYSGWWWIRKESSFVVYTMAEKKCLLLRTQSKVYEGNDVDTGPNCLLNSCFTYRQMVLILSQRRSIYNKQQRIQRLLASQDVLNKASQMLTPKQDDCADRLRLREGCGWWSYSECRRQGEGLWDVILGALQTRSHSNYHCLHWACLRPRLLAANHELGKRPKDSDPPW